MLLVLLLLVLLLDRLLCLDLLLLASTAHFSKGLHRLCCSSPLGVDDGLKLDNHIYRGGEEKHKNSLPNGFSCESTIYLLMLFAGCQLAQLRDVAMVSSCVSA